jgi:hypothetical protein
MKENVFSMNDINFGLNRFRTRKNNDNKRVTTKRGIFLHFCSIHFRFHFNSDYYVEQKFFKKPDHKNTSLRLRKGFQPAKQNKRLSGIAVKYAE